MATDDKRIRLQVQLTYEISVPIEDREFYLNDDDDTTDRDQNLWKYIESKHPTSGPPVYPLAKMVEYIRMEVSEIDPC